VVSLPFWLRLWAQDETRKIKKGNKKKSKEHKLFLDQYGNDALHRSPGEEVQILTVGSKAELYSSPND
jgi:hypothetical protein